MVSYQDKPTDPVCKLRSQGIIKGSVSRLLHCQGEMPHTQVGVPELVASGNLVSTIGRRLASDRQMSGFESHSRDAVSISCGFSDNTVL